MRCLPLPQGGPDELNAQTKHLGICFNNLVRFMDRDEARLLYTNTVATERIGGDDMELNLMRICCNAINILQTNADHLELHPQAAADLNQCIETFVQAGVLWHQCMNLPYDVEKYGQTIMDRVRERRALEKGPAFLAYEGFMRVWSWACCWSPGCRQTLASAGRAFAACSGCRRVTYCSEECQTRAWRHEGVPHRAVCKKIKYIVDVTNLEYKPMPAGAAAFQDVCAVRKVDNGPLVDFSSHIANLQKHMSLASRSE